MFTLPCSANNLGIMKEVGGGGGGGGEGGGGKRSTSACFSVWKDMIKIEQYHNIIIPSIHTQGS